MEENKALTKNSAEPEKTSDEKPVIKNSATFAEQIIEITKKKYKSSHLTVSDHTPKLLQEIGIPNLPILISTKSAKKAIFGSGNTGDNYHGLGAEIVSELPTMIENPVGIMNSLTHPEDSVVLITEKMDTEKRPIIVALQVNTKKNQNFVDVNSNIVASLYGRTSFPDYIKDCIAAGAVVYFDKEKSQRLLSSGLQLPITLDYKTIIRHWDEDVNGLKQKIYEMKENKLKDNGIYEQMFKEGLNKLMGNNTEKKEEKMKLTDRIKRFFGRNKGKEPAPTILSNEEFTTQFTAMQELIAKGREKAKQIASESGQPTVTIIESDSVKFKPGDVLSLFEAEKSITEENKEVKALNAGNYKTLFTIDSVYKGKMNSANCVYRIGAENGGIAEQLSEMANAGQDVNLLNYSKYLQKHLELEGMVDKAIAAKLPLQEQYDVQSYTLFVGKDLNASQNPESFEFPPLEIEHKEKIIDTENLPHRAFADGPIPQSGETSSNSAERRATDFHDKVFGVREEMVKSLIGYIEQNPKQWEAGWNNIAGTAPENGKTGTPYRGLNLLYLTFTAMQKGYTDPRWVTFNQAKELGASVMKGERSSPIIFYELYDRNTKKSYDSNTTKNMTEEQKDAYMKENVYAVLKYSNVFNAAQCHNFPERDVASMQMKEEERAKQNALIESIISNSAAPVLHDGGNEAYYTPMQDKIHLPPLEAFNTMQDYYATALHEIAHSTGHESRLNRDLSGGRHSPEYAKEELRAELACVFMQVEHGLQLDGKHFSNHAAYLNSWLRQVKKDPQVFYAAARDAEKISDYVAENYLHAAQTKELEVEAEHASESAATEQSEEQKESIKRIAAEAERFITFANRMDLAKYYRLDSLQSELSAREQGKQSESDLMMYFTDDIKAVIKDYEIYRSDEAAAYYKEWGARVKSDAQKPLSEYKFEEEREHKEKDALNENIKEWYQATYPNDEAAKDINENLSFAQLKEIIFTKSPSIVYDKLGDDSVVRERAFTKLSEIENVTYDTIYSAWADKVNSMKQYYSAIDNAKRLCQETGEPHVMIEFISNESDNFTDIKEYDVMPFSQADEKFARLDAEAISLDKSFLTRLSINYIAEGSNRTFDCRFEIGKEQGGIVHRIEAYKNQQKPIMTPDAERKMDNLIELLKKHSYEQKMLFDDAVSGYSWERPELSLRDCIDEVREMSPEMVKKYAEDYRAFLDSGTEYLNEREKEREIFREDYPRDFEDELTETLLDDAEAHVGTLNGEHKEKIVDTERDEAEKFADARAKARQLAKMTGEPYVTIEWTEKSNGFPDIEKYDVMTLSEADKKFRQLDARADEEQVSYKTMLHIDYFFKNELKSYENCKFYIGLEGGGIVHHIDEFLKSDTFLDDEERADAEGSFEYFKQYMQEHGEHKEETNSVPQTSNNGAAAKAPLVVNLFAGPGAGKTTSALELTAELKKKGYNVEYVSEFAKELVLEGRTEELKDQEFVTNEQYHRIDRLRNSGVEIIVTDSPVLLGKVYGEGKISPEYDKQILDYHNSFENFNLMVKRGETFQTEGRVHNLEQSKELDAKITSMLRSNQIFYGNYHHGDIDKTVDRINATYTRLYGEKQVETQQEESAEKTVGEELMNKTTWSKINLPDGAVGNEYGKTTLVKMPQSGEYAHFGVFVPTQYLKQDSSGKWQLNVGDKFTYRLTNDGRQVELTGQELKDSFAGVLIGKTPERVAPSRKYMKVLDSLEKNVPKELRIQPNWCVYRTWKDDNKEKKGKVIKSAVTGEGASSKNPADWTDFDTAMKYARENNFEGLAFVLEQNSGITCIDLDKCIKNAETGEMKERAAKLIEELKGTYMERSTSGNGVHIFIKDDILKGGKYKDSSVSEEKGDLEVFDNQRIISMTGDMFSETNTLTRAGSSATVYLRQELGEKPQIHRPQSSAVRTGYKAGSDREVVERIRRSKRAGDFEDLYTGHGITGNASIDDMKLANILAFFTNGDAAQCMRIMREASTYRSDKPESYYNHTISKAIDTLTVRPSYGAAQGASAGNKRTAGNGAAQ